MTELDHLVEQYTAVKMNVYRSAIWNYADVKNSDILLNSGAKT